MTSRQPIYEGTAVSLEYTISGAALQCQTTRVMQLNMHCCFGHEFVQSEQDL